jgi:vanillate O-demethylase ferredoxin subunit
MDFVIGAARAAGWPEARLHVEHFSAPEAGSGRCLRDRDRRNRAIVPVASGQSAATALAEAGIEVPLSCEQGICGTCLTTVLAGVPDHRDMYLSAPNRLPTTASRPAVRAARTRALSSKSRLERSCHENP